MWLWRLFVDFWTHVKDCDNRENDNNKLEHSFAFDFLARLERDHRLSTSPNEWFPFKSTEPFILLTPVKIVIDVYAQMHIEISGNWNESFSNFSLFRNSNRDTAHLRCSMDRFYIWRKQRHVWDGNSLEIKMTSFQSIVPYLCVSFSISLSLLYRFVMLMGTWIQFFTKCNCFCRNWSWTIVAKNNTTNIIRITHNYEYQFRKKNCRCVSPMWPLNKKQEDPDDLVKQTKHEYGKQRRVIPFIIVFIANSHASTLLVNSKQNQNDNAEAIIRLPQERRSRGRSSQSSNQQERNKIISRFSFHLFCSKLLHGPNYRIRGNFSESLHWFDNWHQIPVAPKSK